MRTSRHWSCIIAAAALLLTLAGASAFAASVEIVSPGAGAELKGSVKVEARVVPEPGESLDQVVLQTSRGERLRMAPGFADTYQATLDTTLLRNGQQALLVIASAKGKDLFLLQPNTDKSWQSQVRNFTAEIEIVVANPYRFYWGDLHAHTSYSDGAGLPKEAYESARDKAHLDFFSVTDHSQLLTFEEYQDTIDQAQRLNSPGRFVTLYGVESTEPAQHICIYMSPSPRLPGGLDHLYRAIGETGLIAHLAHPGPRERPADDHYHPLADGGMAMVEVRSPDEEAMYIKFLNDGWHVGAAGCQDHHDRSWGMGNSWTVALAPALTREAILDALQSRRIYSTADRNLELSFSVDGEDMGAQIARPAGKLACVVTVLDPDPDGIVDRIELLLDGKVVATALPKLTKYAWSAPVEFPAGRHYCFVRVAQVGNRLTWSSPVWVEAYG